jgi:X-X-X-Leu-X-X-Gly heptad repeat protein
MPLAAASLVLSQQLPLDAWADEAAAPAVAAEPVGEAVAEGAQQAADAAGELSTGPTWLSYVGEG